LRFRARRWELPKFVAADGFVVADARAKELLAQHTLSARSYSTTALEQMAICPYRFYLHAIARVAELDTPSEPSELGPRERGLLFHEVLSCTLERWLTEEQLPLAAADPALAQSTLDAAFARVRDEAKERYAPAIARVFDITLASLRRDLTGWLKAVRSDRDWSPVATELLLQGQTQGGHAAITLEAGVRLSGAIDLVERKQGSAPELLRATDFKTGVPRPRLSVTEGAHVLQPLLYALALERMYPDAHVSGGRLYFCTREQRYTSQEVLLGERSRGVARDLFAAIDDLLQQGFLPAVPERDACERCEYVAICGPHEQERVQRVKHRDFSRLRSLQLLRRLP
ncbi:MAG: hypothetical protein RL701_7263, partial [Pseudomonadota bacterium]